VTYQPVNVLTEVSRLVGWSVGLAEAISLPSAKTVCFSAVSFVYLTVEVCRVFEH
jgi:hypothetical protein